MAGNTLDSSVKTMYYKDIATPGTGGVGYGLFGSDTEAVVNWFKDHYTTKEGYLTPIQNNGNLHGVVGATTWAYLGLPLELLTDDGNPFWDTITSVGAYYTYEFVSKNAAYPYKPAIKLPPVNKELPLNYIQSRMYDHSLVTEVELADGRKLIELRDTRNGAEVCFDVAALRGVVDDLLGQEGSIGFSEETLDAAAMVGARNAVNRNIENGVGAWGEIAPGSNAYYAFVYMEAYSRLAESQNRIAIRELAVSVIGLAAGVYGVARGIGALNQAKATAAQSAGQTVYFDRALIDSLQGKEYASYRAAVKDLGPAGPGMEWHHIVEQNQVDKSGFAVGWVQNTKNLIAIDKATHAKISGYYNTTTFQFTGGLKVRDWLAGKSYEFQYEFGIDVLRKYEVIK